MTRKRKGISAAAAAIAEAAQSQAEQLSLAGMRLSQIPSDIAMLTKLKSLDLSNNRLTTLPAELFELRALEKLDISDNTFSRLPKEITRFSALRELRADDNRLEEIPSEVFELKRLEVLSLVENQISSLSPEVANLKSLRELSLIRNCLDSVPAEIGALKHLTHLGLASNRLASVPDEISKLRQLKFLYLFNNELKDFPQAICNLPNLQNLTINANDITIVPDEIGGLIGLQNLYIDKNRINNFPSTMERLEKLQILYANENDISIVPDVIWKLTSLVTLSLGSNAIGVVSPKIGELKGLRSLDLSNNKILKLPEEISQLSKLESLELDFNQFEELPTSIALLADIERISFQENPLPQSYFDAVKRGVPTLKALLASFAEATKPLFEAKLLITGEGQVGKSWTLAKLRGLDPHREVGEDNTTWGVDRGELKLKHPNVDGEEITFNTWDFGGQKIYRVTHQFFFSEQAIYVLVWNPRQGSEQCRVREWLRIIALRTGSSNNSSDGSRSLPEPRAKVILVGTHAESAGGSYIPDYGRPSLEPDLQQLIVDEVQIDNNTDYGIDVLRSVIAKHAATLPDMGQPFNARWSAAREAVLALRAEKPWIDFQEFAAVCRKHQVTDDNELRTLAWTYLHSLGRAIWYGSPSPEDGGSEDALLADTIVLDAVWLSRAFVQVLDDAHTRSAGGMLDHQRLRAIWTDHGRAGWHRYKPTEYEILLLVMRRFDVALPTRESHGKRSLVPQLVPHSRPHLPWTDAASANGRRLVRLSCELAHEAPGLMARLVAATEPWHVYDHGVGLFWDRGVFLEDSASFKNSALVTLKGIERPRLDLIVSGDQPAFLMNELYKVIQASLDFWPGMGATYYVKCRTRDIDGACCDGKFKYSTLIRRIKEGSDRLFSCDDCDAAWTAAQLMNGFEALVLNQSYILGHLYHRDQAPCPQIFILEPAEKRVFSLTSWSSFVGKKFKLTLLSELSGRKVASEEFTFAASWVKWVKPLTRLASILLTGAALPISGELATEIQEGAALMDKFGTLPDEPEGDLELDLSGDPKNIRITNQQLVNFAKFLEAIGMNPRSYGMDIAQAPDGRWLWMTAQELEIYRPQIAVNS